MSSNERIAFPPVADGLRIGLLGGSFNPPHDAHRALSLFALKRLRLDRVWWLVSPGNPLKDTRDLPSLDKRLRAARAVADHPAIHVTGIEAAIKTRYTIDTITELRRRFPNVRFVWLMGADNLSQFHRWRDWQSIARQVPLAIVDRPSNSLRALASPAAQALARYRHPENAAPNLLDFGTPAWVFLHGLKSPLSSTELRSHTKRSS
ncbi:nicotinate-nucleotide adenylyltransferase [Bradyrhizobium sp. LHD-71]|uniref:nicotinate-nucleotide adenylyltransferase n=1 Tax=Bradyrhizobium sp. LHD-71 TaxID=3072141 RepID=UPI00281027CB|nr:nicotinate-nucleotide adenylyltransferase [Bradyrhizobium sp. LHD-71]MDQ8729523.1 nicotinate-nucleotide adenylyltransferase [Bradyrhizobium sp. LHD-71]